MTIQQTPQRMAPGPLASAAIAAPVNFTATSSGTGNVVMTLGPVELEGGVYIVELFAPSVTKGTTNADLELFVDGVFNQAISGHLTANVAIPGFLWRGLVSLTPGVHTLTVRGFVDAGTGTLGAGSGATGQSPNAVILLRPF